MKVKFYIHVCTDANGDKYYDVSKDSCDWICLMGKDANGKHQQFDSTEAYHAYAWAERHGFTVTCIEKEVSL